MKIIRIKWIDSVTGSNQWEYKEDLETLKPSICHSVGFLVESDGTYTTICSSDSETQILGRITIPNVAILKKEVIEIEDFE